MNCSGLPQAWAALRVSVVRGRPWGVTRSVSAFLHRAGLIRGRLAPVSVLAKQQPSHSGPSRLQSPALCKRPYEEENARCILLTYSEHYILWAGHLLGLRTTYCSCSSCPAWGKPAAPSPAPPSPVPDPRQLPHKRRDDWHPVSFKPEDKDKEKRKATLGGELFIADS